MKVKRDESFQKMNAVKKLLLTILLVNACLFHLMKAALLKQHFFPDVLIIFAHFGRTNLISQANLTLKKYLSHTR